MASVSWPSRARSADRLSSSKFISRASGHSRANDASTGAIECFRAWMRAMRIERSGARVPCIAALRRLLLEGQGVHQPSLAPGGVQAAIEFQRACLADIALENFAVIAARLDRLQHRLVVETEPGAEVAGAAEQALDRRHVRL